MCVCVKVFTTPKPKLFNYLSLFTIKKILLQNESLNLFMTELIMADVISQLLHKEVGVSAFLLKDASVVSHWKIA